MKGFINGEFGLAEGSRSDVRALMAAGIPYSANNFDLAPHSNNHIEIAFSSDAPYKFNLVNINIEALKPYFAIGGERELAGKYNIAYWVCELQTVRKKRHALFRHFQEVWTPSSFSAGILSRISPLPVFVMPHAVDPAVYSARSDKQRFGWAEDEFVFLFVFDFMSFYERKNPLAAVRAFHAAFGGTRRARLVIKHMNSDRVPDKLEQFKRGIEGTGVDVIDGHWRKPDLLALMASCDCYVSTHRTEGFGLTIAEAMAMGRPVIATGYSGNMEFMDTSNSFPIRYSVGRLGCAYGGPYNPDDVWAEPDEAHASELMRLVYEDRELAREVGNRAREHMLMYHSPEAVGTLYKRRLGKLKARFCQGPAGGLP